jgi:hypothetical protein
MNYPTKIIRSATIRHPFGTVVSPSNRPPIRFDQQNVATIIKRCNIGDFDNGTVYIFKHDGGVQIRLQSRTSKGHWHRSWQCLSITPFKTDTEGWLIYLQGYGATEAEVDWLMYIKNEWMEYIEQNLMPPHKTLTK